MTFDPYVIEWDEARERLVSAAQSDAGWYAEVARRIARPSDRLAVDVGCGGAGMAIALARALPSEARVIALDGNEEITAGARENLEAAGVAPARAEVRICDLEGGLAALHGAVTEPADLVWASAVVHHVAHQQAAVDNLARLLAPGGRLALAEGGLPPRRLPWDVGVGDPGLEMRLDMAQDRWFARMRDEIPGSVPMPYGWTEALRRAGLIDVTTLTVPKELPAPLSEADRETVLASLRMRVDRLRDTELLDSADLAAWDRLLDPADTAWLGHRDDIFSLDARSVHIGTAPAGGITARANAPA